MQNIYWPVYKNLEHEFSNLMFCIHIDDNQLNVYSSNISNLILRAASEIESISKELYFRNGGTKTGHIKYDEDAIKFLIREWKLDKKTIIISSYNCFQSNKIITPFKKNEERTGSKKLTYSWNNSYQNLKHDRANSLEFGSVKYLFDIMSALFILNIYYKDNSFELDSDSTGSKFPSDLGSDIFSSTLHVNNSISLDASYSKKEDFDECLYYTQPTEETAVVAREALQEINEKTNSLMQEHISNVLISKVKNIQETLTSDNVQSEVEKIIKAETSTKKSEFLSKATRPVAKKIMDVKYEAVINKNQV